MGPEQRQRRRDKQREAKRRLRAEEPDEREARNARQRERAQADPRRARARAIFKRALREGDVERQTTCAVADETCAGQIEAHHPDYDKPLEVAWLCRSHHAREHRKEKDVV